MKRNQHHIQAVLLKRVLTLFFEQPGSVQYASRVITVVTLISVLLGGLFMRIFEPDEYPDMGIAMWWAIQTVTTVGYGDVTPKSGIGRFVGAVIMLQSIAFVTVVTATITSNFVEGVRRRARAQESSVAVDGRHRIHARFDELAARIERIEKSFDDTPKHRRS